MAMTTRNTARRVLRSGTAPQRRLLELENGNRDDNAPGNTNRGRNETTQRLDQLETGLTDLRQEFTAAQASLRVEVTAELSSLGTSIGNEMTEIKGHLANLVQALTNMSTTLSQTQAVAKAAQQIAAEARTQSQQAQTSAAAAVHAAPPPVAVQSHMEIRSHQERAGEAQAVHDVAMAAPAAPQQAPMTPNWTGPPHLRKMDVNPPIFDGLIDGIKLNSFLFQFESYFQQKGYNLAVHDHLLPLEMNQCVRKNAVLWYERYMTNAGSVKLWSAMKGEMVREFREPNFQAKVRNRLLSLKQTGPYQGYVSKFRELQSVVCLDELTAINVFVNGLTNVQLKQAIQRTQPSTLTAAVQAGFLEYEIQDKQPTATNTSNRGGSGPSNKPATGKQKFGGGKPKFRGNHSRESSSSAASTPGTLCSHCGRGVHRVEDCWVLHPEKKPQHLQKKQQLTQKIYALLETLDFGDEQQRSSTTDGQSN